MTQNEKRQYMKIAMNLISISVNDKYAAILVEIYEHLIVYKGNVNMKQIIAIEEQMAYEYNKNNNHDKKNN